MIDTIITDAERGKFYEYAAEPIGASWQGDFAFFLRDYKGPQLAAAQAEINALSGEHSLADMITVLWQRQEAAKGEGPLDDTQKKAFNAAYQYIAFAAESKKLPSGTFKELTQEHITRMDVSKFPDAIVTSAAPHAAQVKVPVVGFTIPISPAVRAAPPAAEDENTQRAPLEPAAAKPLATNAAQPALDPWLVKEQERFLAQLRSVPALTESERKETARIIHAMIFDLAKRRQAGMTTDALESFIGQWTNQYALREHTKPAGQRNFMPYAAAAEWVTEAVINDMAGKHVTTAAPPEQVNGRFLQTARDMKLVEAPAMHSVPMAFADQLASRFAERLGKGARAFSNLGSAKSLKDVVREITVPQPGNPLNTMFTRALAQRELVKLYEDDPQLKVSVDMTKLRGSIALQNWEASFSRNAGRGGPAM